MAIEQVQEIDMRTITVTEDTRETSVSFLRLFITPQRVNVVALHSTFDTEE